MPPTEAGHEAVFPCMTMFAGSLYSARGETNCVTEQQNITIFPGHTKKKCWRPNLILSDNASRHCGWDGAWAERTDYSACKLLEQESGVMEELEMAEGPADLEISIIIYLIGEMLEKEE